MNVEIRKVGQLWQVVVLARNGTPLLVSNTYKSKTAANRLALRLNLFHDMLPVTAR